MQGHSDSRPAPLYSLAPVEIVTVPDGAVVRRGLYELLVKGDGAPDFLAALARLAPHPMTRELLEAVLVEAFGPSQKQKYDLILDQLITARVLADVSQATTQYPENHQGRYIWSTGLDAMSVEKTLKDARIFIIASKIFRTSIKNNLLNMGFYSDSFEKDEATGSINIAFSPQNHDMIERFFENPSANSNCKIAVCVSEGGFANVIRECNNRAHQAGFQFLPVTLTGGVAHFGPFVLPGQTSCYECLRARENGNMAAPEMYRQIQDQAQIDGPATVYPSTMVDLVGSIAAQLIWQATLGIDAPRVYGSLISLSLNNFTMSQRPVYKIPRCTVCSSGKSAIDPDGASPSDNSWLKYE